MDMNCGSGKIALPGKKVGGYSAIVHGHTMRHAKFGGPSNEGKHEVFKNEQKRPSTDEMHQKFYAHIK